MSTTYTYDVSTDTANGQVNMEVLIRAILNAGLASGGNFEGGEVDGGLHDDSAGVIVGGTLSIVWQSTLSGADETAQDNLVGAHTGVGFALIEPLMGESLGVSSTSTSIQKLSITPSGPLYEGNYQINASAEVRTQAIISGSYARGRVVLDSVELTQHNNQNDVNQAFSYTATRFFEAGEIPVIEILLEAVGPSNTVDISNARLSLRRIES